MKSIRYIILSLSLFFIVTSAVGQGVKWFKGSFDEALNKAKEENKLVFLYIGTTW